MSVGKSIFLIFPTLIIISPKPERFMSQRKLPIN